ncbi:MAG TPA: ADP-glyceromanno-heptose 6-epimerase [Candidatus Udaeobacter sp.]|nr:ADP-glyceromanno-heptose 6-epimerase [Candidatus Udaeobacter sp.]
MILVTGGAGFIGSNIVAALAERKERIVVCDSLGSGDKWQNIVRHEIHELVALEHCADWLQQNRAEVRAVVHMGAISATTETDADRLAEMNVRSTLGLWRICAALEKPFIFASSAATYGDGSAGFEDDGRPEALARLRPRNAYAWSKHLVDRGIARRVAMGEARPPQWVGLKFFNVFGPNEYHKGSMRSVAVQFHAQARGTGRLRLFKSTDPHVADGAQRRDFVYVRDCAEVVLWLLDNPKVSGLFNVGSGNARSFLELAKAVMQSLPKRKLAVEFFDMPDSLKPGYQNFTEAPMARLRAAGYQRPFTGLEEAVADYVANYLEASDPYR